jgi:adenosylcobinamide-phosphate synthase
VIVLFLVVLGALILDFFLGETKRYHPLVGFGFLVSKVERACNRVQNKHIVLARYVGSFAYLLLVAPIVTFSWVLEHYLNEHVFTQILFSAFVLYIAIGWRSLLQHAKAISMPLKSGDLNVARQAVAMIVSRDTSSLEERDIASAATESILENGADAIFSAIFWFLIAGVPGVVLYRLSNTLDAMWGYKTERFLHFGWCAARMDDVLNFIPARLTALSYAILGNTRLAIQCWKEQGRSWKSPNAGPVMAAGAGALTVSLGGAAPYHGEWQVRPHLGPLPKATDEDKTSGYSEKQYQATAFSIDQACSLVNKTLILWLSLILLISFLVSV